MRVVYGQAGTGTTRNVIRPDDKLNMLHTAETAHYRSHLGCLAYNAGMKKYHPDSEIECGSVWQ
jgi:hypothetical protein